MSGEIFILKPGGGGGGSGGTLTVTGVAGHTVTATNGSKTYTRTLTSSGTATFKGLATGTWTIEMSGGGQTASSTVAITVDYSVTMKYFAATINVTYPAGSSCSMSDGSTTLTAPDTSGTWAAVVPSAGTWTVNCTDGSSTASQAVSITADGQSESVTLSYELVIFDNGVVDGYTWSGLSVGSTLSLSVSNSSGYGSTNTGSSVETVNMENYSNLNFFVVSSDTTGSYSGGATIGTDGATVNFKNESNVVKSVDVSEIDSGQITFSVAANSAAVGGTQTCKLVVSRIWLS